MRTAVVLSALALVTLLAAQAGEARVADAEGRRGAIEGYRCHGCHAATTPGIVEQWIRGAMGLHGVNCYDCHGADVDDPDAIEHHGLRIAVLVTPSDCGRCHPREAAEMGASAHARAADLLDDGELMVGRVVADQAAAVGCNQCHGSRVVLGADGAMSAASWPNSGIGRINPDGSRGSCSACHSRHRFSPEEARLPQSCGRCHRGHGQPHFEAYAGSRHGSIAPIRRERPETSVSPLPEGIAGGAPTCATCHMGAVEGRTAVHDVGARLAWDLGGPLPERSGQFAVRRQEMAAVCAHCHDARFTTGFFRQADAAIEHERSAFASPAHGIMEALVEAGRRTPTRLDERLEWIYRDLRLAERRARAGTVMGSAAASWSDGSGAVARLFFAEFLPEARRVAGEELWGSLAKRFLGDRDAHRLLTDPGGR